MKEENSPIEGSEPSQRLREGKIVLLTRVDLQVEKLHGVSFEILQQLVVSQADGPTRALHAMITVMREMPVYRLSFERLAS